jgi:hypothetical protein
VDFVIGFASKNAKEHIFVRFWCILRNGYWFFFIGYGKGEKEVYFMSLFAMWKLSNLNSRKKKRTL